MSIILNKYDEENRIDYSFYDSSNILFSETDDKKDDLKEVKIVFKDGRTYLYSGVKVMDFIMFRQSISQGKDLFKYIAVKDKGVERYKTTRIQDTNLKELELKKQQIIGEQLEKQKQLIKEKEDNESV